ADATISAGDENSSGLGHAAQPIVRPWRRRLDVDASPDAQNQCEPMKQPQSITSLPESPDAERRRRMVRYLITMVIRVACIILCLFVHGWWLLLPIIGAVVLPYVAVVFANVGASDGGVVERPGSLVPAKRPLEGPDE
ncbi:MAG: DUF3099 domain-containing protein, partial [Rhodoglobus sp.]